MHDYVGNPNLMVVHNLKNVIINKFSEEDRVVNEAFIINQQWDQYSPSFLEAQVSLNDLED